MAPPAAISVRGLGKEFATGRRVVRAVHDLSFNVAAGEVYGLLGPNGAGKTTTLRMVMGLMSPTRGDIEVDGFRVSTHPREIKRRIGLVSANTGLYQWLSTREMLAYFGELYDLAPEYSAARIEELAGLLDFNAFLDRRCSVLSTGQRQRVSLARALLHDPPILLLDEPTRGLDIVGTQVVFDFIALARRQHKAVILSTHQLDEAERFADRFGLLFEGTLRAEGTLTELRAKLGKTTLVEMFLDLMQPRLSGPVVVRGNA